MNLPEIAEVWRRGSVIASWLLDLTATALLEDPALANFAGRVSDSGEGRWTIKAAIDEAVPARVLTAALSGGSVPRRGRFPEQAAFGHALSVWRTSREARGQVTGRRGDADEVLADSHAVAESAAEFIAAEARRCAAERGRFVLAVSGGSTPAAMLRVLADLAVPWDRVHVFQVDERVAPLGDPARNLTQLHECLLAHAPLRPEQVHAMPVEQANLDAAARSYAAVLCAIAGTPPVLDLVHLGLGVDGHTASLVPGDPSLDVREHEVALAGPYQGRRRMTLTFPVLDRARRVLWVVTGRRESGDVAAPARR